MASTENAEEDGTNVTARPRRLSVEAANERRVLATAATGEVKLPRVCALLLGQSSWLTFLGPAGQLLSVSLRIFPAST